MRKLITNSVHIAFQGPEIERISFPIIRMKADKAYIFIYNDDTIEKFMDQYYEIEKQLQDAKIEVIRRGIEIHNYIAVIQNISKIIKEERVEIDTTEIFINLSVGTKITAIAALDACRFWDCTPYYVRGEEYLEDTTTQRTLSSGKMTIYRPPVFKLQKPPSNLIEALKIIIEKKEGIYKKKFREKLIANKLLIIQKQYEPREASKKLSAEYMAMNQQYVFPLRDIWGYIHVSDAKRNQKITLTEEGEEAVQIFKFLS